MGVSTEAYTSLSLRDHPPHMIVVAHCKGSHILMIKEQSIDKDGKEYLSIGFPGRDLKHVMGSVMDSEYMPISNRADVEGSSTTILKEATGQKIKALEVKILTQDGCGILKPEHQTIVANVSMPADKKNNLPAILKTTPEEADKERLSPEQVEKRNQVRAKTVWVDAKTFFSSLVHASKSDMTPNHPFTSTITTPYGTCPQQVMVSDATVMIMQEFVAAKTLPVLDTEEAYRLIPMSSIKARATKAKNPKSKPIIGRLAYL